jgi:hypothetical protein
MANDWYTADNCHVLKAKKMATFRNGDAKLQAADVQKMDILQSQRLFEPIAVATPTGSGTFLGRRRTTQYLPGRYQEVLEFQTGMQLYPSLGLMTTADDTPVANYYTHTGAIRTIQTPTNQGRY